MKSAEEILTEKLKAHSYRAKFSLTKPAILEAMEEYAAQKVKEFRSAQGS